MPTLPLKKLCPCAAAAVLFSLAGCATPEDLGGSVAERYSLAFSDVRAYWLGAELVISFEKSYGLRHAGAFGSSVAHQIARLSFNSDRQALVEDVDIPVAGPDVAVPFATIEHYAVINSEGGGLVQAPAFAAIAGGQVHFAALSKELDARVAGKFDVEFADGKSLWGDFDALVVKP